MSDPDDINPWPFPPPRTDDLPVADVAQALASALLGLDDDQTVTLLVQTGDGRAVEPAVAVYDAARGELTLVVGPRRQPPPLDLDWLREHVESPWINPHGAPRREDLQRLRRAYGFDPTSPTRADPLRAVDVRIVPFEDAGEPPATGDDDR